MDGVVAFFDKNDIPGKNTFTPAGEIAVTIEEELFCSGTVLYHSQPIGIVVAKTQDIAQAAAEMVEVTYTNGNYQPLYTVREVLKAGAKDKIIHIRTINPKSRGKAIYAFKILLV